MDCMIFAIAIAIAKSRKSRLSILRMSTRLMAEEIAILLTQIHLL